MEAPQNFRKKGHGTVVGGLSFVKKANVEKGLFFQVNYPSITNDRGVPLSRERLATWPKRRSFSAFSRRGENDDGFGGGLFSGP